MKGLLCIPAIVDDWAKHGPPVTPEERAASCARTAVQLFGPPRSDIQLMVCAKCLAEGTFHTEWPSASEGQRWDWIDMCERALRDVCGARAPP